MRKVLLSLTLLIAGAMSVWAQTTTSYLVKEATTTLTDGTYVLVAMTNHGTGPCYYSSEESDSRYYRYDKNVNVQAGGYIDGAQYIWTIDETTTGEVQKITVTNVGYPTKAFPADGSKNQNFTGSVAAELITEKHTINGVDYFALTLEDDAIGYIHANAPGGNPNLSYWDSYNDDGTCVKFRFYPVEEAYQFQHQFTPGAYYRLVCVSPKTGNGGDTSYKTLTWDGKSNLVTSPMDIENNNQVFMFEDAGDGKYYLKNLVAGKYLNKINQGAYRSAVVDKANACKLEVSPYEGVVGQFKLHNSESTSSNHCLFAENHPSEAVPYACSGWNNGANSASAWHLVSVSLETLFGAGTETSPYLINNVDDLILFRNSVNAGETKYSAPGVYVALGADIDLAGQNWVGIGSIAQPHGFMGNFDGKNFKIKNLTITDPAADSDGYVYAGLFSITEGTDQNNQNVIKNLTIENVTISTTGHIVSAAIAYPYCTIVDNVTVCGKIDITGGDYTAGALAYTRRCVNASNVTVAGTEGSTITGASVVGGVISDIQMNGGWIADYSNFSASGVSITGTEMVGGISGIIATQTLNGASVKNVTLASGDSRIGIISGAFGGTSTISNVVVENVTGATAIVGPTYKGANPVEAKIGDTYYSTLAEAVKGTGNVELLTDVTLKDDVAYASTSSKTVTGKITYTRNLIAGWNPIYLPFATELSTEEYDVATFTSAKGETVTLSKIEDATATLAANTAYVIRPKTDDAKTLTITLENATLEAATVEAQKLGEEGFSVKGNYSVLTGAKLGANDRVVGTNGDWGVLKSTSTLKPYRLILTIPSTAKAISMRVEGEDVTSIENLGITIEGDVIFDLMGRRVETMTEGGIYIVNGKKIVF